jgi:phage shock protein PspC (stress-responsive transcriptional regulator)
MDSEKKLLRPRDGVMIGGVCAGIARYFGIDVTIVRLLAVLIALAGIGSPILIYLICWIVIPQEDAV